MPLPRQEGSEPAWHTLNAGAVRQQLAAPEPLSEPDVCKRLTQYGFNRLPEAPALHPLARLGRQLHNVLIYVLLSAVVITGALGHYVDAGVILGVVVIQTLVGFIQEGRAEQALSAIRDMLAPRARVIRADGQHQIDAAELVPGDTVLLEPGDRVPADLRLEKCNNLKLDEAILTGESEAVDKTDAPVAAYAALGDQTGMAFSRTMVATGTGRGVVVRTGALTEIGRISGLLASTESLKTPLLEQMDRFARRLSGVVILAGLDNFASIAAAVREGRTVYTNLRKSIAFMLPINGGESVSLIFALLLGLTLPISPLQILWVNMVSSVLLAMEVFYLFAVRYLDTPSITLRGVMGTPVVLAAVVAVLALQTAFTYLPWFQGTFGTLALPLEALAFTVLAGTALLVVLELETALRRRLTSAAG